MVQVHVEFPGCIYTKLWNLQTWLMRPYLGPPYIEVHFHDFSRKESKNRNNIIASLIPAGKVDRTANIHYPRLAGTKIPEV